jgi:hypothetical protein
MPEVIMCCDVVQLNKLMDYVLKHELQEITMSPPNDRVRVMHYTTENDLYYLFNEGETVYKGKVMVPTCGKAYVYDAWNNIVYKMNYKQTEFGTELAVSLEPGKSLIVVFNEIDESLLNESVKISGSKIELNKFKQSICKSIEYPNFKEERDINTLVSYSLTDKKFSGFIRYETFVDLEKCHSIILKITDAYEGVEVFVNGKSAGIQVVPSFIFDITSLCVIGQNNIMIEVATTLERENKKAKDDSYTGITGNVNLYYK